MTLGVFYAFLGMFRDYDLAEPALVVFAASGLNRTQVK
jgi:hypothetical protein